MNTIAHVTTILVRASVVLGIAAVTGCAATAADGASTDSKAVRIDESSITSLGAGETVRVDLTQPVVYEIAVPASARDRILVHTAKEDCKLPDHLQKVGVAPSVEAKVIRLSGDPKMMTPGDVSPSAPEPEKKLMAGTVGGGGLSFSCSLFTCSCTGDTDCNDMFESGVCGGDAICIDDGCHCWRWGRSIR